MLERHMEEAVANCPDLFIEPGLQLARRQVVTNGRRPNILFSDALSRPVPSPFLNLKVTYGGADGYFSALFLKLRIHI